MNIKKSQRGSFLLEALISVLLFMVGLIALISVSAQTLNQVGQSKYRNDASYLVGELIGEIWASGAATPNAFKAAGGEDAWISRVAAALPGGTATLDHTNDPQVDIVVSWNDARNPGVTHKYITTAVVAR